MLLSEDRETRQLTEELARLRQRVTELAESDIKRRRAELKIQQQNEFLNNVLNSLTHPLYVVDVNDYTVVLSNQAAKVNDLSDKVTCYSLAHKRSEPCRATGYPCPLDKVKETRKPVVIEHIHYDENGSARNITVHGYPVFNKEGNIIQMIEYCLDITEHKEAEEALHESEERYRELAESITDVFFAVDGELRYTYWNKASEELTGISAKDALGKHLYDIFPRTEETRRAENTYLKVLRTKQPLNFVNEYHLGGKNYFFAVNVYPTKDGLSVFVKDITEYIQAEKALRESEEKYRRLFELSPVGIAILDTKGTITSCNPAIYRDGGYSEAELIGKHFSKIASLRVKDIPKFGKTFASIVSGKMPKPFEVSYIQKDGTTGWTEVQAVLLEADGRKLGVQVLKRDITKRKQAMKREKELQQELNLSRRLASIGMLAAGVAHEINNPLTGIMGFSERLLRKNTDEEITQDLERIHSEAQRAARVVENLRTFARRREIKKEFLDINEILGRTLELRAYELRTGNIELAVEFAPDIPKITGDFGQIQQVFLNIILNAEQAMTEANDGGRLAIKTLKGKGCIRVSFTDDGPGIPAEHLGKLFDPFFTTRGERGGTGLGLSVCHGIVTEHGGKIYAKSKPGKGATFFIELPDTVEETGK